MVWTSVIEGKYVSLKSATVEDAEFTLNIRQDVTFEKFMPKINQTLEKQKAWIEEQREKAGDYFFVVRNRNYAPIGTIGIYGLSTDKPESGRLVLKGNAFENFEAAYLLYEFAFNTLHLESLYGYVYADNKRAIRYNKQFGVVMQGESMNEEGKLIRNVSISAKDFNKCKVELDRMMYRNIV